ncbi:DUF294 nucleotidyltransferase-like domain-containing protein [Lederbergia sp. NSJ-179]|uniref:DUF294 nucleotidyltransferase-like domain-containing protein n=1 Tax=Lederbergia sp. NSJ-179 TaxID=2931402 RepID=UPI001FCFC1AF|nr:DUF294 nucleotidyltransferase-like domain-containing protein [Lederbergia sp. NSJ-179]MCJ7842058.1 DUF294 nucleotidyltransferase-like domain-containing protein [Lederbergia sp. NSJ-179]
MMQDVHADYASIKQWRDAHFVVYQSQSDKLQDFHDYVTKQVFDITLRKMRIDHGAPPCPFTWFVTGSSGRCEQAYRSDQDHGIVYTCENKDTAAYFLEFGKRLTAGLEWIGYPLCQGNVMSSNPLWCKSLNEWESQIHQWIDEDTWQSFRYLLIFLDARVIESNDRVIYRLKNLILKKVQQYPYLLRRLFENTRHTIKAIGFFHQFLPIQNGAYTGCIDLKQQAYFPYVNAIRLLAIKENISHSSTLSRMESLSTYEEYKSILPIHRENFRILMKYRLKYSEGFLYEEAHYLNVRNLNKQEKHEVKRILTDLNKLLTFVEANVVRVSKNES